MKGRRLRAKNAFEEDFMKWHKDDGLLDDEKNVAYVKRCLRKRERINNKKVVQQILDNPVIDENFEISDEN